MVNNLVIKLTVCSGKVFMIDNTFIINKTPTTLAWLLFVAPSLDMVITTKKLLEKTGLLFKGHNHRSKIHLY